MALRKKRKTTAELALSCDIVRKYGQKLGVCWTSKKIKTWLKPGKHNPAAIKQSWEHRAKHV